MAYCNATRWSPQPTQEPDTITEGSGEVPVESVTGIGKMFFEIE